MDYAARFFAAFWGKVGDFRTTAVISQLHALCGGADSARSRSARWHRRQRSIGYCSASPLAHL